MPEKRQMNEVVIMFASTAETDGRDTYVYTNIMRVETEATLKEIREWVNSCPHELNTDKLIPDIDWSGKEEESQPGSETDDP